MDETALARAKERISGERSAPSEAGLDRALTHSREHLEALARATAELEKSIPSQLAEAVRDGLRSEVLPVARHIAELRGLFNQANRRLARIEADLKAERQARLDDLALLVELVSSGWRGVDSRLARLEPVQAGTDEDSPVEQLRTEKKLDDAADDEPGDIVVERAAA